MKKKKAEMELRQELKRLFMLRYNTSYNRKKKGKLKLLLIDQKKAFGRKRRESKVQVLLF